MRSQRNSLKAPINGTRTSPSEAQPHPPPRNGSASRLHRPNQSGSAAPAAARAPPTSAPGRAPRGTSPAAPRSRSPVFWGATEDAPLYSGPLGESVGCVTSGTVVLEASRYRDVFGGWWISTRCHNGSLGWLQFCEDRELSGRTAGSSVTSPWQRVYDTRATPSPSRAASCDIDAVAAPSAVGANISGANVNATMAFPQVNAAAIAELEAKHFLFQDTILFQYYWDSVPAKSEHRDWNEEYQRALEEYRMMPQLSSSSNDAEGTPTTAKDTLTQVLEEFRQEVVESVMRVCAEAVLPLAQRRLCAMPQHANEVFFINGLVIKRCVDTADGDLGGDGLAAKLGNAMYRNNEIIALEAPSHFLYTPLQARCTFGGHSFLCSTIPPYGRRNLLYASPCLSAATGKTSGPCSESTASSGNDVPFAAPSSPPPLVLDLLRRLGNALHLHGGEVPWEWRVYAGRDRRLYLSHTARLLPPVLPLVQERRRGVHGSAPSSASETGPTSAAQTESEEDVRLFPHIVRSRVRPEVFLNWPTEWRANECCFVADEAQQHQPRPTTETELRQAAVESTSSAVGQWIKADGITRVAGIIGFHLPLSAVPMPIAVCNGCQSTIDANEIRLVVCTNPSRCCRVCIQCYTRGVMGNGDAEAGEEPSSDERLSRIWADAVRCGAGCRRAGCVLMEPSITAITHAHGLNLRYLPYVLHRLPLSARPAVEHFIHVELVARAAKYVLQQDLCRATTATEARSVCEAVLSALLQPTGAVSEHFWRTRLGPVLQAHFEGICEPFQVSVHALCAVAERAQSLTGVWLSDASLASLDALSASAKPTPLLRRDIRENANTSESGAAAAANNDDARPFVEIVSITPRTWVFPVAPLHPTAAAAPDLSDKESSQASPLWRRLESIILFWIGYTPEDAEDRLQPFYLDDSMFHSNA